MRKDGRPEGLGPEFGWTPKHEGFARSFAQRHGWRLLPKRDEDDLYAEILVKWLEIREKYPDRTPGHQMSTFVRACRNLVASGSLANYNDMRSLRIDAPDPEDRGYREPGREDPAFEIAEAMIDAPPELRVLLERARRLPASMRRMDGSRETTREKANRAVIEERRLIREACRPGNLNRTLCRIAGLDPDEVDLVRLAARYRRSLNHAL